MDSQAGAGQIPAAALTLCFLFFGSYDLTVGRAVLEGFTSDVCCRGLEIVGSFPRQDLNKKYLGNVFEYIFSS